MITLVVRRRIRATPERLFAAWTEPAQLLEWWGPRGVKCIDARIDLRVGGRYSIANRFPDGRVLWISGEFEVIEPPHRLEYTWRTESQTVSERVAVRFEPDGDATDVTITHERILDERTREMHERGWSDCLDGLALLAVRA
jgi:uncharacterized protein YndB with AHSA1/START domain